MAQLGHQRKKKSNQAEKKVSDNVKSDPRKFYRTFRPFTDFKNKQENSGNICLKVNDVLEGDQTKVANHFANFFSTMADGIGGDHVNDCAESDFMNHNSLLNISTNLNKRDLHENHFEFNEITCEELRKVMNDLIRNKSRGYDRMDPKVLKVGATELAPSLAVIFNQAIRNGEWIAKLKRGEWTPVHKKDDKQRDPNYRPITVLPCVNKVYEVLLGQQVSKFMDDRLSDAITTYRAKNSCENTLIRLTETWRAELESKKIVGILSSDMSRTFDSVSPQLLINKLQAYNFSDKAIQLIRSYFQG